MGVKTLPLSSNIRLGDDVFGTYLFCGTLLVDEAEGFRRVVLFKVCVAAERRKEAVARTTSKRGFYASRTLL